MIELAASTPGTYELIQLAHVRDRSTRVLEVRFLEARFGIPMQAGNGEEVLWVTRRDNLFTLDTFVDFSGNELTPKIRIHDDPNRLPTILIPFNTVLPFENRIIDLHGNISSQERSLDPLAQNPVGIQL